MYLFTILGKHITQNTLSPIMIQAIVAGDLAAVQAMHDANEPYPYTALKCAARLGNMHIVKYLCGLPGFGPDYVGTTDIVMSAGHNLEVVQYFCQVKGVKPSAHTVKMLAYYYLWEQVRCICNHADLPTILDILNDNYPSRLDRVKQIARESPAWKWFTSLRRHWIAAIMAAGLTR